MTRKTFRSFETKSTAMIKKRHYESSRQDIDLLFKQIVSFYVRGRGFGCLAYSSSSDEVMVFTEDYLEQTKLIQNTGTSVLITMFGDAYSWEITDLESFLAEEGGRETADEFEDASRWKIPTFKHS